MNNKGSKWGGSTPGATQQIMRFVITPAKTGTFLLLALVLDITSATAQTTLRGDANSDAKVDISDPVYVLTHLFSGGEKPRCVPVADANADARLDISDAVAALNYLFTGNGELKPLTAAELQLCDGPPAPTVLRTGRLIDILDPGHGIDGRAELLSNRSIRLRSFSYDGLGDPQVVVLLTRVLFDSKGFVISPDLRRDQPYNGETLEFSLPEGVTGDDFDYVAIWCDAFPLTFAYAELLTIP